MQHRPAPPAESTLVLLGRVVVVDLFSDALPLAKISGQILLLLLIVVAQEFFPIVRIDVLFLFDDLPLHLLLNKTSKPLMDESESHL